MKIRMGVFFVVSNLALAGLPACSMPALLRRSLLTVFSATEWPISMRKP